jgi:DNA-binding response OmpR family regulator
MDSRWRDISVRLTRLHPYFFLTARSEISDVVEGFELGANDYLKKPFGMQELIVRIRSLAKRAFYLSADIAIHFDGMDGNRAISVEILPPSN